MSKYTIEQKNKAVKYALQASSLSIAANELNIPTSTLHDWVREHRLLNSTVNKTSTHQELLNKDKEIKRLKEELEILKKFKAFSAKKRT